MKRRGNRRDNKRGQVNHGYMLNRHIDATELRVIGSAGENHGVISLDDAVMLAEEQGLDLVQISKDKEGLVTAKIIDFGKFLYEKKKSAGEAKKKQKTIDVKELKLRPSIDDGDYNLKIKRAIEFLSQGKHVKITLQFRGREMAMRSTVGPALFERIVSSVREGLPNYGVEYQKESGVGSFWTRVLTAKCKQGE